jgi:hypothetical protein
MKLLSRFVSLSYREGQTEARFIGRRRKISVKAKTLISTVLALGVVLSALATPKYLVTLNKTYTPAKGKCASCHVGTKKDLNVYGKDVQKAMREKKTKDLTADILKSIEKLDSDKDGVSNGDELKAGTLPGDAKSKPEGK